MRSVYTNANGEKKMDLNINVNSGLNNAAAIMAGGPQQPANAEKASDGKMANMTITHAAVAPEDVAAAGIPDEALLRDDALGKLVASAFSMPPPPMPIFK